MRISQSLQLYSTLLLFLSVLTSAWPWPRFLPDIDSLVVRGGNGQSSNSGSGSTGFAPQWTREMLTEVCRCISGHRNKYWFISTVTDRQPCLEFNHQCSVKLWFRSQWQ